MITISRLANRDESLLCTEPVFKLSNGPVRVLPVSKVVYEIDFR